MLYLVLTSDSLPPPDTVLTALLGTTGTPVRFEYRTAERFAMHRASDGASFEWRTVAPARGDAPDLSDGFLPRGGNYGLAEAAGLGALGRRDLVAGETYTLEVETGNRSILGAVTIPLRPQLSLSERTDGRRVVTWSRDGAVGLYAFQSDTDALPSQFTADTFYVLRDDIDASQLPAKPRFRITALDTNWVRYMRNPGVTTAGLSGAYGLFGAMSSAEIVLPPR